MFGTGLLKGLGVTLKHFVETYVDDVRAIPSRYAGGRDLIRQAPDEEGLFTIQYPEEKRQLPERFRYIPMLIYDTPKDEDRCTACGICAKVCPPQCIWIVRDKDEKGKPVPRPAEFYIDASICMSCGFCSEFCPFDAIKMNHDYELAVYERYPNLVYNMQELTVPLEYYASLYPTQFAEEEKRRAEEEAKKAKKPARAERKPAAAKAAPAAAAAAVAKPAAPRTSTALSPEELEKRRAEAKARVAARKAGAEAAAAPEAKPLPATARTSTTLSPEELEKRRAEARARVAARKGEAVEAAPPAEAQPSPVPEAEPSPAPEVQAAPPTAAPTAGYGKPNLAAVAHTSGTLSYAELEERRAAAHERYKTRKGSDAKVLHAAAVPAQPAVEEPVQPAAETVVAPPAETVAPPAETVEEKPAPVEAAEAAPPPPEGTAPQPGGFGKPELASAARTSGTLDYEQLEKWRAENYARYKARKGPDAKDLGH